MKKAIYYSVFVFINVNISIAADYFPFKLGNSWQYHQYRSYSDTTITSDTTIHEFSIVAEYTEYGELYFEINNLPGQDGIGTLILRKDTLTGELFTENECLWLNPQIEIGDTVLNSSCTFISHFLTGIDSLNHFTLYRETHFYQQNSLQGVHIDYQLFEGIGPIRIELHNTLTTYTLISELVAAEIDGITYGEFVDIDNEITIPSTFKLYPTYPNPFNPVTTIRFYIANTEKVSLKIYDVSGRHILTIFEDIVDPNNYAIQWDATGLSSGIYFLQLIAGSKVDNQKLILLK
ncbi:MAG: T9SS type A sorting domain-containing protein [FCB group bacterium]|nr:T9SS type A sorting domain-containing protein [FCB group bacterium]